MVPYSSFGANVKRLGMLVVVVALVLGVLYSPQVVQAAVVGQFSGWSGNLNLPVDNEPLGPPTVARKALWIGAIPNNTSATYEVDLYRNWFTNHHDGDTGLLTTPDQQEEVDYWYSVYWRCGLWKGPAVSGVIRHDQTVELFAAQTGSAARVRIEVPSDPTVSGSRICVVTLDAVVLEVTDQPDFGGYLDGGTLGVRDTTIRFEQPAEGIYTIPPDNYEAPSPDPEYDPEQCFEELPDGVYGPPAPIPCGGSGGDEAGPGEYTLTMTDGLPDQTWTPPTAQGWVRINRIAFESEGIATSTHSAGLVFARVVSTNVSVDPQLLLRSTAAASVPFHLDTWATYSDSAFPPGFSDGTACQSFSSTNECTATATLGQVGIFRTPFEGKRTADAGSLSYWRGCIQVLASAGQFGLSNMHIGASAATHAGLNAVVDFDYFPGEVSGFQVTNNPCAVGAGVPPAEAPAAQPGSSNPDVAIVDEPDSDPDPSGPLPQPGDPGFVPSQPGQAGSGSGQPAPISGATDKPQVPSVGESNCEWPAESWNPLDYLGTIACYIASLPGVILNAVIWVVNAFIDLLIPSVDQLGVAFQEFYDTMVARPPFSWVASIVDTLSGALATSDDPPQFSFELAWRGDQPAIPVDIPDFTDELVPYRGLGVAMIYIVGLVQGVRILRGMLGGGE